MERLIVRPSSVTRTAFSRVPLDTLARTRSVNARRTQLRRTPATDTAGRRSAGASGVVGLFGVPGVVGVIGAPEAEVMNVRSAPRLIPSPFWTTSR